MKVSELSAVGSAIRLAALVAAFAFASAAVASSPAGAALSLDPSFGAGGIARAENTARSFNSDWLDFAPRPQGGFVAVGGAGADPGEESFEISRRWTIAAFNADGTPDANFGTGGRVHLTNPGRLAGWYGSTATAVAVQSDGKIVVGGAINVVTKRDEADYAAEGDPECDCFATRAAFLVARFSANGSLDVSYGQRGYRVIRSVSKYWTENALNAHLTDIAIDAGGGAIVLGHTTYNQFGSSATNDPERVLLYRFTSTGRLDRRFGGDGRVLQWLGRRRSFSPSALLIGADGTLTVAGALESSARSGRKWIPYSAWAAARFSSRGRLDRGYGRAGLSEIHSGRHGVTTGAVSIAADGAVAFSGAVLRLSRGDTYPIPHVPAVGSIDASGRPAAGFGVSGVARLPAIPARDDSEPVRGAQAVAMAADGGMHLIVADEYNRRSRYDRIGASGSQIESQDLDSALPQGLGSAIVRLVDGSGGLFAFANETDSDFRSSKLAVIRFLR